MHSPKTYNMPNRNKEKQNRKCIWWDISCRSWGWRQTILWICCLVVSLFCIFVPFLWCGTCRFATVSVELLCGIWVNCLHAFTKIYNMPNKNKEKQNRKCIWWDISCRSWGWRQTILWICCLVVSLFCIFVPFLWCGTCRFATVSVELLCGIWVNCLHAFTKIYNMPNKNKEKQNRKCIWWDIRCRSWGWRQTILWICCLVVSLFCIFVKVTVINNYLMIIWLCMFHDLI